MEIRKYFDNNNLLDIKFDTKRKVSVIKLLRLEDYKKSDKKNFSALLKLSKKFIKQKGEITFFISTPRGGGVALMRHSLIRLYRLLGVNAHWYVMSSKKQVFEITKKKFHNILQAVAPKNSTLTNKDKKIFFDWNKKNAENFKNIFTQANVIVIDDPQPSGMLPYIKKINPYAKIIFRSHIQLEAKLINKPGTPQNKIWKYIWNNIKQFDIFVTHPVKSFIPKIIPKRKLF